jgi:hypothetical protein
MWWVYSYERRYTAAEFLGRIEKNTFQDSKQDQELLEHKADGLTLC